MLEITNFYKEIKNKYISLKEIEQIKAKYKILYKNLKFKAKNSYEKQFIKNYKNIEKFIEEHNTYYLEGLRQKTNLLNNINGYPLDKYQSRVVLSNEQASLVIAGAGSGKSLTIIGKIVYLVKECHINPSEILCISFTNDATINLQKNISKNYNFDIEIYTFHKLALNILKQNNINYQIAPDNYLTNIINTFFDNYLPHNELYKKALTNILGKSYSKEALLNLKRLILTFINLFKSNNYNLSYFKIILRKIKFTYKYSEYKKNKSLMLLIINIYLLYENELSKEEALDFNDMINKSIAVLKKYGLNKKWRYIIIDEYQDTSLTKFYMIKEIIKITKAQLLAVGDDFQSIYRFTGCNLHMFFDFTKYFTYSKLFYIVNTYRNPQELINVAGSFVMKNKYQQKKILKSNKTLSKPIIIYEETNKQKALKELLNIISKEKINDIMVLGRNNKDILYYIDDNYLLKNDKYTYNNITFRYLTVHKSKGLESDVVILINVEDSLLGFPTKIKDEKILKYVNNNKELYPYDEERRLFYVALTRTKNKVYIISNSKKESVFIKEIKKYTKYVVQIKK